MTWIIHWQRIGRKFSSLRDLVVRLIFDRMRNWVAGREIFGATPMLKAVRRSC